MFAKSSSRGSLADSDRSWGGSDKDAQQNTRQAGFANRHVESQTSLNSSMSESMLARDSESLMEQDLQMIESYKQMLAMTFELVQGIYLNFRPGDKVLTSYGQGEYVSTTDGTMKIKLSFGVLYCPANGLIHKLLSTEEYEQAMDHLEQTRKLQLAIQFLEWGIDFDSKTEACVACLFQKPEVCNTSRRRRRPFWKSTSNKSKSGAAANVTTKTQRCDVCGNPVCAQHRINMGGDQEYFILCVDCSHDLSQLEQNYHAHPQLMQNMHRLVQYYTRMSLQLCFCIPNLKQLGMHLTSKQMRDGAISLGNSAIGFVGAALGVAGAAAMLTPAGPAILLAAVTMSATSGTFQGIHSTYNLLSNKTLHQLTDRCLGWHGLCLGILNALVAVRSDLMEQQRALVEEEQKEGARGHGQSQLATKVTQSTDIWNSLAVGSFATTRSAMTGVGVTSAMGASYSQAISTGLQGIPVVGAAFSVGCMAMDANSMAASFTMLNTPAKKAVALQGVESSFPRNVLNTIWPEVELIQKATDDLHARIAEHQLRMERDLIERELEGLGGIDDNDDGTYNDEDIERELQLL